MKKRWMGICCLMLVSGCVILPTDWPGVKNEAPMAGPSRKASPAPPVTADQVTETNAHDKAKALQEEMEKEARGPEKP